MKLVLVLALAAVTTAVGYLLVALFGTAALYNEAALAQVTV